MISKLVSVLTVLFLTQSIAQATEVEYTGVVEISADTIIGSDDTFVVSGVKKGVAFNEGLHDSSSQLMTFGGGLDATNDIFKFQLIGGYGFLHNGDLSSKVLKLDAAAYYMGNQMNKFGIGAHIASLSFISPSWSGAGGVELRGSNAIAPGIGIFFGDMLMVKASLDYVTGSKMVVNKKASGTLISSSSVSVDGPMAQIALLYKF